MRAQKKKRRKTLNKRVIQYKQRKKEQKNHLDYSLADEIFSKGPAGIK
jgi:hypothetical protein